MIPSSVSWLVTFFSKTAPSTISQLPEEPEPPKIPEIVMQQGKPMIWAPPNALNYEKAATLLEILYRADYGYPSTYLQAIDITPRSSSITEMLSIVSQHFNLPLTRVGVHDIQALGRAMIDEKTDYGIPRSVIARIINPEPGYMPRLVIIDEILPRGKLLVRDVDFGMVRVLDQSQFFHRHSSESPVPIFRALPKDSKDVQSWRTEIVSTWTKAPLDEQELLNKAIRYIIERLNSNDPECDAIKIQELCMELSLENRRIDAESHHDLLACIDKEKSKAPGSFVLLPLDPFWAIMNQITNNESGYSLEYRLAPEKSSASFVYRGEKDLILRKNFGVIITCPPWKESTHQQTLFRTSEKAQSEYTRHGMNSQ